MPNKHKPTLVFPYHDPHQQFVEMFKKNLGLLQSIFDGICISATPLTVEKNNDFLVWMEENNCLVYRNKPKTNFGDHFRAALRLFLNSKYKSNSMLYGFIDNILFELETHWKDEFVKDITHLYKDDLVIFSRSERAWQTRPKNYRVIEKSIMDIGKFLTQQKFDWLWCVILMKNGLVKRSLKESKVNNCGVLVETILTAFLNGFDIKTRLVDWLEWEDPFWEKLNQGLNKADEGRKTDMDETLFRLRYCIDSLEILYNKFKNLK